MLCRLTEGADDGKKECFSGSFQVIYESKKEPCEAELLFLPAIVYNLLSFDPEDPLYLLFAPGAIGGFRIDERE